MSNIERWQEALHRRQVTSYALAAAYVAGDLVRADTLAVEYRAAETDMAHISAGGFQ